MTLVLLENKKPKAYAPFDTRCALRGSSRGFSPTFKEVCRFKRGRGRYVQGFQGLEIAVWSLSHGNETKGWHPDEEWAGNYGANMREDKSVLSKGG